MYLVSLLSFKFDFIYNSNYLNFNIDDNDNFNQESLYIFKKKNS